MRSRAAIRWKCAFTYMNAVSRKNLTDARAVNANDLRTALDTGAAFSGVTGIAPSRQMIVTCMWGVSDPLRVGRGAKKGAAKMGVAHAPLAALLGCDTGADRRAAAQNAARCSHEAADWQPDTANAIVHE